VILDEPEALALELDKVWARIEEAHERSEVGNLVRPADLYLTPESWRGKDGGVGGGGPRVSGFGARGGDGSSVPFAAGDALSWRGARDDRGSAEDGGRRHAGGSGRAGIREKLSASPICSPSTTLPIAWAAARAAGESYADETSYFAGDVLTTTLLKAYLPDGFCFCRKRIWRFLGRATCLTSRTWWRRVRNDRSRRLSAFLSDFRDLQVGDYVVHVEHGSGNTTA